MSMYHESEARRRIRELDEEQRREGERREAFGGAYSYEDWLGRLDAAAEWQDLEQKRQEDEAARLAPYRDLIERIQTPTFQETARAIYDECYDLLIQRQIRYGPANIERQGMWGVLSRIANDKLERIKRAFTGRVENGEIVLDEIADGDQDESFEDAVKDVINYGVILLMLKRGEWGRPLGDE